MYNNSSSNGATGEASFMTVLQQAGVGGRGAKHSSKIVTAQLDEIISNFVSHQVKKMCYNLVGGTIGEEAQLASGSKVIIIFSAYLFIIYFNLYLFILLIWFIRGKKQS